MAFLTIYTPTYKRPLLLAACVESVRAQTCEDLQHLIIHDEIGIGIEGMFAAIPSHAGKIVGEYVYILQDDDKLADENVVRDVRTAMLMVHKPPVLMVKNKKRGQVFPLRWRQAPVLGAIDLGSYIVRADVFRDTCHLFGKRYAGDYDYIAALWGMYGTQRVRWFDRLVAEAQIEAPGLGRSEESLRQQWAMA